MDEASYVDSRPGVDGGDGSGWAVLATHRERIRHVERLPAREARSAAWPSWVHPDLRSALQGSGVHSPWSHQAEAAELARGGEHVAIATGTASGKSVSYWLPAVTSCLEGSTAIYISPTKALANDQARTLSSLAVPSLRHAVYDGDTPSEERTWARRHAAYVMTNPDMLHFSILPGHASWSSFLRALAVIVIDECHVYRGVFGSHVSSVIRRLRRVAERYGASPVVIAASATVSQPGHAVSRLIGAPVREVTDDGSPRAGMTFAMWQPPMTDLQGERGEPLRRGAVAESADLLADLVSAGVRTLAFARSRRGVETISLAAKDALRDVDPALADSVAAYRGGYLPEERRELERRLRDGRLLGVAATNALELGVDVSGLDAVVIAGWPGTRASLWQQAGRAGRAGREALAVFVARDDPLDSYIVEHPDAVFGRELESTVLDPANPYVLAPHLCAAASEFPLEEGELERWFGSGALGIVDDLTVRGLLRHRPRGWFWTSADRAVDLADLRGTGGSQVRLVEAGTGRVLGTIDPASAHTQAHEGAVYVHQGEPFVVIALDLDDSVAIVEPRSVDYYTVARDISDIRIVSTDRAERWGDSTISFGEVDVTSQVVSYLKRRTPSGEILGEEALDLPTRELRTRAVWWTVSDRDIARSDLAEVDLPGAAHAAEHASIGILPLVATCDRWDIGGVSTALHPDTGLPTVFVYDGYPGGAGFAERGYESAREWLHATRLAIADCSCVDGCPACVQSPKCGNGNDPLDKAGAIRLLDALLSGS